MAAYATLREHLNDWAGKDAARHSVAETIINLAAAGTEIAAVIALGPLAGDMAGKRGGNAGGDTQKELDVLANTVMTRALKNAPVAWMGSEEDDEAVALNPAGTLAVNIDPLDGSSNIETNVSIGTIFSILPASGENPLLQPGHKQLAAGYIVYGPQTTIVLTLGQGTHIFWLDPKSGDYVLAKPDVRIPVIGQEYAINSSNARHWDAAMKAYIADCEKGKDGPRQADFNMRWVGSLVADTFRILMRGGIYLYPGDGRKGYAQGRLRLLYEANPIAMIVEQAGGACTTGNERILDVQPHSLHQRAPLIFGSNAEVEEVQRHYREQHSLGERSPLVS